jgi:hypothetical protein
VLYTAYFDESDTHGAAPTIIMAGLLGHARQWKIFGRRLRALQRRDGFTVFHATEFKAKQGDFKGLTDSEGAQLVHDLTALVQKELTEGTTVYLPHATYLTEYRATPHPSRYHLDSQYGLCFRACLAHQVAILRGLKGSHRLDVVFEQGHKNQGDVTRVFADVKKQLLGHGIDLLGDCTPATKHEAPPLMAADFLAHTYSMMQSSPVAEVDYKVLVPEPPKREAGLSFLEFEAGSLTRLKEKFVADRQAAHDGWLARREARRAGKE